MSLAAIIENANAELEELLSNLAEENTAKIGLDTRAGRVYVDTENQAIIVHKDKRRSLDYYGGFEYVCSECITQLGDYVIYWSEDGRVEDALRYYMDDED